MSQRSTCPISSSLTMSCCGVSLSLWPAALIGLMVLSGPTTATEKKDSTYDYPTHSSPISLSQDGKFLWSVNPGANTVSVIDTTADKKITDIALGRNKEPQSVALSPDGHYAFVANAQANSVSIIRVKNTDYKAFDAVVEDELLTGAEPWNVVVSPDGQRAFVANSGQDTVSVLDIRRKKLIGAVKLRNSLCNDPDRKRHYQPRGLAVTKDNRSLYVTRFFSFTTEGGKQGVDSGREGIVCRLDIDTESHSIYDYEPVQAIPLAAEITGFKFPNRAEDTLAFPNQLQSIVIRGDYAYLPNIAASPSAPLRFNVDTQAFINVIGGVNGDEPKDAPDKFINAHLGAQDPEPGKIRLFFANVWDIGFTTQSGAGDAYVVAAGSDLLVKLRVDVEGKLNFTVDGNTTRYIDLNDPKNPATSGDNAGKNPLGLAIKDGNKAYVTNFVSGNISIVDLRSDSVIGTIRTTGLPTPGSAAEVVKAGAEQFFSSRGHYNPTDSGGRPHTVSTDNRLSQEGWQACSSCHFKGLSDSVIWNFETGPRKSIPLNSTWNPRDRGDPGQNNGDQRLLNYSAVRDEVEDFELNARNISGPGDLATPIDCSEPPSAIQGNPTQSAFNPDHGLILGDLDPNKPPCLIVNFNKPNSDRNQITLTLPGSATEIPAQTAMREWVRFAVRTPNSPLTKYEVKGGVSPWRVEQGRKYFEKAGCIVCHGGANWTSSRRDFVPPPDLALLSVERSGTFVGNPTGAQSFFEVLRDVESFNLGVEVSEPFLPQRPFRDNIGAEEKIGLINAQGVFLDGLGFDYNNDGKGNGFNPSSLLGIHASPPYLHNGACETILCVLEHLPHRIAGTSGKDVLDSKRKRYAVAVFVESIDANTKPFQAN